MPERPPVELSIAVSTFNVSLAELQHMAGQVTSAAGDVDFELSMAFKPDGDESRTAQIHWAESLDRTVVTTYDSLHDSWQCSLNTAIAAASSDLVLVLEPGASLHRTSLKAILSDWTRNPTPWLSIPVYPGQTGDALPSGEPLPFMSRTAAFLCRRTDFLRIRGYDERPDWNLDASADLRVRLNRAGLPSKKAVNAWASLTEAALPPGNAHNIQKHIESDPSIYRNLTTWSVPPPLRPTLVSVAIATRNRAEYLLDSINSVRNQSMGDFELIIVDDGSTDNTRQLVESVDDPRVRYLHQAPSGISAARNYAADEAAGFFTAVHDDDDIMLPDRLEVSLSALTESCDASYGSWVNFDNDSGSMILHVVRDNFNPDLVAFNGQGPGHSTWLVPTQLIRRIRYDETYSASVDHNLATRMAWDGCRWTHTGRVAYLRRIHDSQVSTTDGSSQKIGHVLTKFANEFSASDNDRSVMRTAGSKHVNPEISGRNDLFSEYGPWLPDHLVKRVITFRGNVSNKVMKLARYSAVEVVLTERDLTTGRLLAEAGYACGITWADMVRLRSEGEFGYDVTATLAGDTAEEPSIRPSIVDIVSGHVNRTVRSYPPKGNPVWIIGLTDLSDAERNLLRGASRRSRLVAASDDERICYELFGYKSRASLPSASEGLEAMIAAGKLILIDPVSGSDAESAKAASSIVRNF